MTHTIKKPTRRACIIVFVIVCGVILRLFLTSHAYPNLVFDSLGYVEYAQSLLGGLWPMDPRNKNMGYPFFIALVFWVRKAADIEFLKFIQILLDLCAGLCIWIAAKRVFSQKTADIALSLYMINPFTSSYTGIILPEVLSCFLVGVLVVFATRMTSRRNIFLWILIGISLGLILFVKSAMLYFVLGCIAFITIVSIKKEQMVQFLIMCLVGLCIASSYTLFVNYQKFGKILLVPPYSTMFGQTYVMSFYAGRYPEVEFWGVAPQLSQVMAEYEHTADFQIPQWNKHYLNLFIAKIMQEPFTFFSHYLKNIFWLWDKDHLSVYVDPWYPKDRYILRIINLVTLGLGVLGIILYMRRGWKTFREPFIIVTLLLVATMSLQFPLVSNESRHTIPFYPLLYFWNAYAISRLLKSKQSDWVR